MIGWIVANARLTLKRAVTEVCLQDKLFEYRCVQIEDFMENTDSVRQTLLKNRRIQTTDPMELEYQQKVDISETRSNRDVARIMG